MTAGIFFVSTIRPKSARHLGAVSSQVQRLQDDGWHLTPHSGAGRDVPNEWRLYWSEPYDRSDVFGLLEAPDFDAAAEGIARLQAAGWDAVFERTQWLVGPRDLPPSLGLGPHSGDALGFMAAWDWNDAWHGATPEERREYDAECDIAFNYDVELGSDIFGRFDTGVASDWEQIALWEVPSFDTLVAAMGAHEAQRDFMFTTSWHIIGRPITVTDLEELLS